MKEDLQTYWPKLRSGGILAGHDYLDAGEVAEMSKGHPRPQDWTRESPAAWGSCLLSREGRQGGD